MFELNQDQREAVDRLHDFVKDPTKKFFVIKGYAGVGKSSSIQRFLRETDRNCILTSPTHKACRVLRQMRDEIGSDHVNVQTIHALLGLRPNKDSHKMEFSPIGENQAEQFQVVVVDEGSMVSTELFEQIRDTAYSENVKFIFMGDPLQLPPVREEISPVFAIPDQVELTKVMRHDNQILNLATELRHSILEGRRPNLRTDNDENGGVYCLNWRRMRQQIKRGYKSDAYAANPNTFRTVAWTNKTVHMYNEMIREFIYDTEDLPKFSEGERVVMCQPVVDLEKKLSCSDFSGFLFHTDDEATVEQIEVVYHPIYRDLKCYRMHCQPDYSDEMNPVWAIHEDSERDYQRLLSDLSEKARSRQGSWGSFWDAKESVIDVRPCHAITSHRSQGSTYETVFVDAQDILRNPNESEALRCLYVAASRAKKNVILQTS
ncbi:ATP-dependent DNA helicase [Endozoicomonas sp. ALC066]|uniref:ATP-dependent DNA helicase n=1 Tax=Endozoicomonas sp. ALC066 TaxID=3403078 RepID=UPI003BB61EB9